MKHRIIALVLLISIPVLQPAAPKGKYVSFPAKAVELETRARAAMSAKDLDKAKALWQERIALSDLSPEAHYQLGILLLAKKQDAPARAEFEKALAMDPLYADPYLRLAGMAQAAGDAAAVKSHVRRFLALAPEHPKAAAAASLVGLSAPIRGRWVTAAEDEAVKACEKGWAGTGLDRDRIFRTQYLWDTFSTETQETVKPGRVLLWDDAPAMLLSSDVTSRQMVRTSYVGQGSTRILVGGTATVLVYVSNWLSQNDEAASGTLDTVRWRKDGLDACTLRTFEKAREVLNKRYQESYTQGQELNVEETDHVWQGVPVNQRADVFALWREGNLTVLPDDLVANALAGILVQRVLPADRTHLEIPYMSYTVPFTAGEHFTEQGRSWSLYPFQIDTMRLRRLEDTTIKEGDARTPVTHWKAEDIEVWVTSEGRLAKVEALMTSSKN